MKPKPMCRVYGRGGRGIYPATVQFTVSVCGSVDGYSKITRINVTATPSSNSESWFSEARLKYVLRKIRETGVLAHWPMLVVAHVDGSYRRIDTVKGA